MTASDVLLLSTLSTRPLIGAMLSTELAKHVLGFERCEGAFSEQGGMYQTPMHQFIPVEDLNLFAPDATSAREIAVESLAQKSTYLPAFTFNVLIKLEATPELLNHLCCQANQMVLQGKC
jgi:hypothetical protein